MNDMPRALQKTNEKKKNSSRSVFIGELIFLFIYLYSFIRLFIRERRT